MVAKELAFKALDVTVSELSKGGVTLKAPDRAGVKVEGLAENVRARIQQPQRVTKVIFSYRSWWGAVYTYSEVDSDGQGPKPNRADEPPDAFGYELDREVVETVNIKLRCMLQYNGPEVWATFDTAADGTRSRLGSETTIDIKPQLDLDFREAPEAWKKAGIDRYPVIYLPVSVFVDEPWPTDNLKASFHLVLSGMYGFGDSASGPFQVDYQEVWD